MSDKNKAEAEAKAKAEAEAKAKAEAEAKAKAEAEAKAARDAKKITVRILNTTVIEGEVYVANQLVSLDESVLKLADSTAYDAEKSAVEYCESIDVKVIVHGQVPEPESEKTDSEE